MDDEPSVLPYISAIVKLDGYDILQADGGNEALVMCEGRDACIGLMISDVAMPKMNGSALAKCMNRRYPGVPAIFVSGYPESREIVAGLTARGFDNGYTFLQKPFKMEELRAAIKFALKPVTLKSSA